MTTIPKTLQQAVTLYEVRFYRADGGYTQIAFSDATEESARAGVGAVRAAVESRRFVAVELSKLRLTRKGGAA